jgi:hypothetical protein
MGLLKTPWPGYWSDSAQSRRGGAKSRITGKSRSFDEHFDTICQDMIVDTDGTIFADCAHPMGVGGNTVCHYGLNGSWIGACFGGPRFGHIYLMDNGYLLGWDYGNAKITVRTKTGDLVWNVDFTTACGAGAFKMMYALVVGTKGTIFAGGQNGYYAILDQGTGAVIHGGQTVEAQTIWDACGLQNGNFASDDSNEDLILFNGITGLEIGAVAGAGWAPCQSPSGYIYMGGPSAGNTINSYTQNGALRWTWTSPRALDTFDTLLYAVRHDDAIYYLSSLNWLYAVDKNGTTLWEDDFMTHFDPAAIGVGFVLDNRGYLVGVDNTSRLAVLNTDGGEILSKSLLVNANVYFGTSMVGKTGKVYFGYRNTVTGNDSICEINSVGGYPLMGRILNGASVLGGAVVELKRGAGVSTGIRCGK